MRVLAALLWMALAAAASMAHPMGNFTVNHYSALTLDPGALRLHYVLDMAELPTISERQAMDADQDDTITDAEINAYLAKRVPEWMAKLAATSDGKPLAWTVRKKDLEFTAGVAGLAVLRIEVDADAPLTPGRHEIAYEDTNYGQRVGWKEIVLATGKGIQRPAGTESLKDISRALRAYPEAMLNAPLQVSKATFAADIPAPPAAAKPAPKPRAAAKPAASAKLAPVKPAPPTATAKPAPPVAPEPVKTTTAPKPVAEKPAAPTVQPAKPAVATPEPATATVIKPKTAEDAPPAPVIASAPPTEPSAPAITPETRAPLSGSSSRWSKAFHDLVTQKALTPGALAVALLIAFVLGALHALQPGHGKTLVAAYLVGQHGTPKHAALLGLTVTISHTFGVFALGAVALYAQHYILPQDLFPWIGFASGALIALLGAGMLYRHLRPSHTHHHDHTHEHEHGHTHEHSHDHSQGHEHPHAHEHSHDHEHAHHHAHAHAAVAGHGHDHHHEHTHDHTHEHEHHHGPITHSHGPFGEHTHEVPDNISIKSLLALGISGGIVPCWDALIVLLGAISLHRVAFGMLLIVAFSAGLAATLTAAGLAVVWGKDRLGAARLAPARVRLLSMASNTAIIAIGIVIAWRSLASR